MTGKVIPLHSRPLPPVEMARQERWPEGFVPAPDVGIWARMAFLTKGSPLYNAEHEHLENAVIGVLWTNVYNGRNNVQIAGTAEMPNNPKGGKWQRARHDAQLFDWFGVVPHFLITLDAVIASVLDDLTWCALLEHEMYHCAQAVNEFGPRFNRETGEPIFALQPHDAEEFVGIVRRYGVDAAARGVRELVAAAAKKPEIGRATAEAYCGTCHRKVA